MRVLQGVNTALSIADTGRSLVAGSGGGGAGSVSALSAQINSVGAELTSAVRSARNAIQQDIGAVNSRVSTVLAQQEKLQEETQQVIAGVAGLNAVTKKHMSVVQAQFQFLAEEDVQNACYQLDLLSKGEKAVRVSDEKISDWLEIIETWINKDFSAMKRMGTISSEDAVQILLQSPDNIAFIASRLNLLFGDIIPGKYLSLPFVSKKFYFLATRLLLEGFEKYPHLMGSDKAQTICQKILDTLKLYLEFSTLLRENIVQALFDQYNYQLTKNASLAQELLTLLKNVVPLLGNKDFTEKLTLLEKTPAQSVALVNSSADIWDNLPAQPNDRVKKLFALLSQDNPSTAARTKYMLLPDGAAYTPIPSQINWANGHASPDGSSTTSNWGCSWFPNKPKSSVFVSVSELFLLLASGYADKNFFQNSTLKKQVGQLIANCPNAYSYAHSTGGSYYTVRFDDVGEVRISNVVWNYSGSVSGRALVTYNGNTYSFGHEQVKSCNDSKTTYITPYTPNSSIYSGHRANIFEYHAKLTDVLPADYDALLKNTTPSDLEKCKILFKYYVLYSQGELKGADTFIRQQTFAQEYEKSYFLFMVAILGRWDIFEAFNKAHPIAKYNWTFKDTAITPLMLAEQYGHPDVVDGLKAKPFASAATDTSDYEKGLEKMRSSVSASKTKLGEYIPAPVVAPQTAQAISAIEESDGDDVTDNEQEFGEHGLKEFTDGFFKARKIDLQGKYLWEKSAERKYKRPGYRLFHYESYEQGVVNDFSRDLKNEAHFDVINKSKEKCLLVKLGLGDGA